MREQHPAFVTSRMGTTPGPLAQLKYHVRVYLPGNGILDIGPIVPANRPYDDTRVDWHAAPLGCLVTAWRIGDEWFFDFGHGEVMAIGEVCP